MSVLWERQAVANRGRVWQGEDWGVGAKVGRTAAHYRCPLLASALHLCALQGVPGAGVQVRQSADGGVGPDPGDRDLHPHAAAGQAGEDGRLSWSVGGVLVCLVGAAAGGRQAGWYGAKTRAALKLL